MVAVLCNVLYTKTDESTLYCGSFLGTSQGMKVTVTQEVKAAVMKTMTNQKKAHNKKRTKRTTS